MTHAPDADVPAGRSRRRITPTAVWGLVVIFLAASAVSTWLRVQVHSEHAPPGVGVTAWLRDDVGAVAWLAAFGIIGAVIVSRRPRQPIGWVMLAAAAALAIGRLGHSHALLAIGASPSDPPTLALVGTWVAAATGFGLFAVLAIIILPLLYPDGRLPSSRWRPVLWAAIGLIAVSAARGLFSERLSGAVHPAGTERVGVYDIANPLAVGWVGRMASAVPDVAVVVGAMLLFAAAVTAVMVRYRRSRGTERLQMRWFVLTPVLLVLVISAVSLGSVLLGDRVSRVTHLPQALFLGYPLAVGVAVLRYRLYEIDRIISRTVAYGLVVAVLGAVYVVGVVGLGAAMSGLTGREDSDLAVAASVLVVVALFGRLRARVQRAVDRRFNRTGYQARQAVDGFANRLRDQVDLETIGHDLLVTTTEVVQPENVSLWSPDREGGP